MLFLFINKICGAILFWSSCTYNKVIYTLLQLPSLLTITPNLQNIDNVSNHSWYFNNLGFFLVVCALVSGGLLYTLSSNSKKLSSKIFLNFLQISLLIDWMIYLKWNYIVDGNSQSFNLGMEKWNWTFIVEHKLYTLISVFVALFPIFLFILAITSTVLIQQNKMYEQSFWIGVYLLLFTIISLLVLLPIGFIDVLTQINLLAWGEKWGLFFNVMHSKLINGALFFSFLSSHTQLILSFLLMCVDSNNSFIKILKSIRDAMLRVSSSLKMGSYKRKITIISISSLFYVTIGGLLNWLGIFTGVLDIIIGFFVVIIGILMLFFTEWSSSMGFLSHFNKMVKVEEQLVRGSMTKLSSITSKELVSQRSFGTDSHRGQTVRAVPSTSALFNQALPLPLKPLSVSLGSLCDTKKDVETILDTPFKPLSVTNIDKISHLSDVEKSLVNDVAKRLDEIDKSLKVIDRKMDAESVSNRNLQKMAVAVSIVGGAISGVAITYYFSLSKEEKKLFIDSAISKYKKQQLELDDVL